MMAIGISLIFLVAITVFERLDVPISYLDTPIYYGCLRRAARNAPDVESVV